MEQYLSNHFNSQPHKEADSDALKAALDDVISTHSLTRRLTDNCVNKIISQAFQLTASQGGWQRRQKENNYNSYFNSQPHKEADGKPRV